MKASIYYIAIIFLLLTEELVVDAKTITSTNHERKKKDQNQALKLEKFITQAGPVMEKVIEENQAFFELNNRGAAAKRNAVECK